MNCNHEHNSNEHHSSETPGFWRSRTGIGFIVIGSVAGYFLVTEHWAHVVGFLPFLLLLSCPLMHIFMHGGHGGHGGHSENSANGDNEHQGHKGGCCGHHTEDKKTDVKSLPSDLNEKPSDKGDQS